LVSRDGKRYLVAVTNTNSGDDSTKSHYGTVSGGTRMSTHAAWIDSVIAADGAPRNAWSALRRLGRWPETPAGEIARQFMRSWNDGSVEGFEAFIRDHMAAGRRTPAERARSM